MSTCITYHLGAVASLKFLAIENIIISTSLSISKIQHKRCYTRLSPIPCVVWSVGLSLCVERVLWQNGSLDPDAVYGDEWGRLRHSCIRWIHVPQGKGEVWGLFSHIGLKGVFLKNRNVFNWCVRIFPYGQYIVGIDRSLAF